jgi:hypothetical protein
MEISWGCHGTFMEYKMGCKMRCKMGCTIWVKWCKIGTFQFPACKRLPEGSYFFHFFPVLRWGITSPKPTSDLLQQSHTILPWCQVDALWNVRDIRAPWHGWPATSCWITILIAACHLLPYFKKKHSPRQSVPVANVCQSHFQTDWWNIQIIRAIALDTSGLWYRIPIGSQKKYQAELVHAWWPTPHTLQNNAVGMSNSDSRCQMWAPQWCERWFIIPSNYRYI